MSDNVVIKYSELINDDGGFDKLKDDFKNLGSFIEKEAKKLEGKIKLVDSSNIEEITKLQKQLQPLVSATEKYKKVENEVNKLDKERTKLVGKLSQAESGETKEIIRLKEQLKQKNKEIRKEIQLENASLGAYKKKSLTLNNLRAKYKDLAVSEQATSKEAKNLLKQIQKLDTELKEVDASTGQSQRNVGNYKSAWGGVKSVIGKGLGLLDIKSAINLVTKGLTSAITASNDYRKALNSLKAITGLSGDEFLKFKSEINTIANDLGKSAIEITKSFELVGSAQPELLKNEKALSAVTKSAIILSQASGDDLVTSTNNLTNALNQFNLGAEDAEKAIDILAQGSVVGASNITQTSDALKVAGASASGVGVDLKQTVGAIEVLSTKLKGAEAGTQLRNILLTTQKTFGGEQAKIIEKYGVNLDIVRDKTLPLSARLKELSKIQNDVNAISSLFGKVNTVGAQQLLQNVDLLKTYNKELSKSGTAQTQAALNTDNLGEKYDKLKNKILNTFLSIEGGAVTGAIGRVLDFVTKNFEKAFNFINKNFFEPIVEYASSAYENFRIIFQAIYDAIKPIFQAISDAFGKAGEKVNIFQNLLRANALGFSFLAKSIKILLTVFKPFIDSVIFAIKILGYLKKGFGAVKSTFSSGFKGLEKAFSPVKNIINDIIDTITEFTGSLANLFSNVTNKVKGFISSATFGLISLQKEAKKTQTILDGKAVRKSKEKTKISGGNVGGSECETETEKLKKQLEKLKKQTNENRKKQLEELEELEKKAQILLAKTEVEKLKIQKDREIQALESNRAFQLLKQKNLEKANAILLDIEKKYASKTAEILRKQAKDAEISKKELLSSLTSKLQAELNAYELELQESGANSGEIENKLFSKRIENLRKEIEIRRQLGISSINQEKQLNELINSRLEKNAKIQLEIDEITIDNALSNIDEILKQKNKNVEKLGIFNIPKARQELEEIKKILEDSYSLRKQKINEAFDFEQQSLDKNSKEFELSQIKRNKALEDLKREHEDKINGINSKSVELQKNKWKELETALVGIFQRILDQLAKNYEQQTKLAQDNLTAQNKAVENQENRAEKGLANTLAFEKKAQVEKEKELIKAQKREERIKKLQTFYNLIQKYSSDEKVKNPVLQALKDISLTESIKATFGDGGIVGIDGTPQKNGILQGDLHSNASGGIPILAEGGEGIFSRKEMSIFGNQNFYDLKKTLARGHKPVFNGEKLPQNNHVVIHNNNSELISEVRGLRIAFEENQNIVENNLVHGIIPEITHIRKKKGKTRKSRFVIKK